MTYLRAIRQPRLRWIVTAALLASLAGLTLNQTGAAGAAGSATTGAATAGASTSHGGSKPTVVLVHGAWADSGSWDQVVADLQRQGYSVVAFPTPLRGLPDDSAYLAAFLAATQRPASTVILGQPSGPPAWAEIPSWALVGTADHVIPPTEQLFMAERAQARIVTVNASHLPMVSHPGAVTRLIVAAARSASPIFRTLSG